MLTLFEWRYTLNSQPVKDSAYNENGKNTFFYYSYVEF